MRSLPLPEPLPRPVSQLRLMDEKYMELRTKLDFTRMTTGKEVTKYKALASSLRAKWAAYSNNQVGTSWHQASSCIRDLPFSCSALRLLRPRPQPLPVHPSTLTRGCWTSLRCHSRAPPALRQEAGLVVRVGSSTPRPMVGLLVAFGLWFASSVCS